MGAAILPEFYHISLPARGRTCYLENALEFLDQPGEWYLDRSSGTLSYYPRPGEDLATAEVVAPTSTIRFWTSPARPESPVQNLHFRGIEVQHVDWPLPPEGYVGMFGCLQLTVQDEPSTVAALVVDRRRRHLSARP